VVVVGSGASGVHFAQSLLGQGKEVTLVDVGHHGTGAPLPEAGLSRLKSELDDPCSYFLGEDFQGVLLPSDGGEYYGIPPSKGHVLAPADTTGIHPQGFAPLYSFARGGLAEVWTGGSYPYNDRDLRDYPFDHAALAPHYGEVARRIGITGAADDLAGYMPVHDHLQPPLDTDEHSRLLLKTYQRKRDRLRSRGWVMGRARSAVLGAVDGERQACAYLGRCLWGCPNGAFYTPEKTLAVCRADPGFTYMPGLEVESFTSDDGGHIKGLTARRLSDGEKIEIGLDRLVLAAGTMGSTRIVLESLRRQGVAAPRLTGLMDNRQILVPFVNLRMLGRPFNESTYQYHQLAMAMDTPRPEDSVFGLVTTLKTALLHPIVQGLPFDLRTSLDITRSMHAALGLVNVNLPDHRRADCYMALHDEEGDGGRGALQVQYVPDAHEPDRLRRALRQVRSVLRTLGCVVPPGMVHVRPMGASVHYAGTLPMSATPGPWTTTAECRSRDFSNLWLVDGSTLPFLPAKNVTFTLMANACRVAAAEF
jgi:choline dehydrogenase-like flavoprotein